MENILVKKLVKMKIFLVLYDELRGSARVKEKEDGGPCAVSLGQHCIHWVHISNKLFY